MIKGFKMKLYPGMEEEYELFLKESKIGKNLNLNHGIMFEMNNKDFIAFQSKPIQERFLFIIKYGKRKQDFEEPQN